MSIDISLNSDIYFSYNVNYECEYKNTTSECDDLMEELYQQDIVQIFQMEEFDYENMIIAIEKLHQLLIQYNITEILECANILAARFMTKDPVIGLIFLFSYDYLFATHKSISDIIVNKKVSNVLFLEELVKLVKE
jgi:hypothetical protein